MDDVRHLNSSQYIAILHVSNHRARKSRLFTSDEMWLTRIASTGDIDGYSVEMLCSRSSLESLMALNTKLSQEGQAVEEQRLYIQVQHLTLLCFLWNYVCSDLFKVLHFWLSQAVTSASASALNLAQALTVVATSEREECECESKASPANIRTTNSDHTTQNLDQFMTCHRIVNFCNFITNVHLSNSTTCR